MSENNISMHGKSFQFDEATDTIEGYIQKVKQVAALLDYGDLQILELFKNTLPSRLYYMLYHIDNLREAVEAAKRVLAKEQMDKKAGQASASLFMQINQSSSKHKDTTERRYPLMLWRQWKELQIAYRS